MRLENSLLTELEVYYCLIFFLDTHTQCHVLCNVCGCTVQAVQMYIF